MKKYFRKFLSYSIYRKTLLTYSVSILLITIVIIASLYGVFIVSIKQNSIESTQQLLTQLVIGVDNIKADVDNLMTIVANDSKTLKFVQSRGENKSDNYYLFLMLQSLRSSYSYIVDISVINFDEGVCIQSKGSNYSGLSNIEYASSMLRQQKYIDVRTIRGAQKEENAVSFLQYLPYYNAALIVDVYEDRFYYSISDEQRDARSVYIIDDGGAAVTGNARSAAKYGTMAEYFTQIISEEKDASGAFVFDDQEQRQLVFCSHSESFGWWFADIQDYSYFNSKFNEVSFTFIAISSLLVLICALISIVFNKKIRRPLMSLAEKYKNMTGGEEGKEADELEFLDHAIARGKHEKYLNEIYIKSLYLHHLALGEQLPLFLSGKQMEELRKDIQADYYCVMLFRIQSRDALPEEIREEELKICRYAVCNLSDEIFGSLFRCRAVDLGEELVGLLFLLDKQEMNEEYILCFKQLKECADQMFDINVTGSLGPIVNDQKDVYISCQKARQYLEMNQLINREDLIDSNNQVSMNYLEKNQKLIESILEYTECYFNHPDLSLKSISQVFGLSSTYLGKIFKAVQGEAYSSYVTNYRLEKSKEALLSTAKTVNEIAIEMGFTNSTYYATLFKNTYGMTPTAFRNRYN